MNRRRFVHKTAKGSLGALIAPQFLKAHHSSQIPLLNNSTEPIAISTWNVPKANEVAGKALSTGKNALDAAIEGVAVEESNSKNTTVGKGGAPDRDGQVTLDACVMDHSGNCGAVMAVQDIVHVAALARDVMQDTPHVILTGTGARKFALEKGYVAENLLTDTSRKAWQTWLKEKKYHPEINVENHDTIGMLCRDKEGNLSGVCSTSGLAYKMKGRVGDSPVIGSGLFVDNNVGAAVATGMGEEVIKTVGSFLVVELIRQGKSPQQACEEAVNRIIQKTKGKPKFQVAYLAMDKKGNVGAYSIHSGFSYMKYYQAQNENKAANAAY